MTGRQRYVASKTGQITPAGATRSTLQIHELGANGLPLCSNKPGPGKTLVPLGRGRVTCGSCARITGH
jgi:hypothetical protein